MFTRMFFTIVCAFWTFTVTSAFAAADATLDSKGKNGAKSMPAALLSLEGHWRFVDDSTVIGFTSCRSNKALVCAVVKALPPPSKEAGDLPPKCGQEVLIDFAGVTGKQESHGVAIDPADNSRYRAKLRLEKGRGPRVELVVSALGGLVTEVMLLEPATEPINACK